MILIVAFRNATGVSVKTTRKAFLKYIGDRKWRKVREANISIEKPFLIYLGNRKWKRKIDTKDGIYH